MVLCDMKRNGTLQNGVVQNNTLQNGTFAKWLAIMAYSGEIFQLDTCL